MQLLSPVAASSHRPFLPSCHDTKAKSNRVDSYLHVQMQPRTKQAFICVHPDSLHHSH
jgi:hypothetical protein